MTTSVSDPVPLRPFIVLWLGQALSLLGSQLVQFALIWHLTRTTGSATVLAAASLLGLLPQIVLGPFLGALVDRWSRKRIMLLADSAIALATVVLALLFASGQAAIGHIYLLLFVRSLGAAFHHPAMTASTTLMVPARHLTRVQGFNQMLQGGLNVVSAPLGALLIELVNVQAVLAIDVGTAAIAVAILLRTDIPQPAPDASDASETPFQAYLRDVTAGLSYLWQWTGLMMIIGAAAMINLLIVPGSSMLPLLVTGHFGGGALQLGWLQGSFGLGVVLGGLILGAWGGFPRRVVTTLMGFLGIGVGFLTVGLAPADGLWLALIGSLLMGSMISFTNGPLIAAMQASVDPRMQGRVLTIVVSLATAAAPLGLIVAGPLADRVGVQLWYILGGVVSILMGLAGFALPPVMNLESDRRPAPFAAGATAGVPMKIDQDSPH